MAIQPLAYNHYKFNIFFTFHNNKSLLQTHGLYTYKKPLINRHSKCKYNYNKKISQSKIKYYTLI